jgi:hypothetical protein
MQLNYTLKGTRRLTAPAGKNIGASFALAPVGQAVIFSRSKNSPS